MSDGSLVVAGRAREFALLVDRGGEALDQLVACRILLGYQRRHLAVALLRFGEAALVEGAVRHHRPGDADAAAAAGGSSLSTCCATLSARSGSRSANSFSDALVSTVPVRESFKGLGEAQRAVDAGALQRRQRFALRRLLLPGVAEQRRITGVGRYGVVGVLVGDLLVLDGGFGEVLVLVEQLGEQEVVLRRLGVVRVGRDVGAVPLHRFPW